jgi:hypothetical protein
VIFNGVILEVNRKVTNACCRGKVLHVIRKTGAKDRSRSSRVAVFHFPNGILVGARSTASISKAPCPLFFPGLAGGWGRARLFLSSFRDAADYFSVDMRNRVTLPALFSRH